MTDQERQHHEFVNAAAAVYAWVCAADGHVTRAEVNGFIEYLSALDFVDEISEDDFSEAYLELIEAFESDFDDGLARAQSRIETFSGDDSKSRDLINVARKALIADGVYNDAEEKALKDIADLLAVDL